MLQSDGAAAIAFGATRIALNLNVCRLYAVGLIVGLFQSGCFVCLTPFGFV